MIPIFSKKKISLILKIHLFIGWFAVSLLVSPQTLAQTLNVLEFYACDAAFCPDDQAPRGNTELVGHTIVTQKLNLTRIDQLLHNTLIRISDSPVQTRSLSPDGQEQKKGSAPILQQPLENLSPPPPSSTNPSAYTLQGLGSGLDNPQQEPSPSSMGNDWSSWQGVQANPQGLSRSAHRSSNFKPRFGTRTQGKGGSARASKVGIQQGEAEIRLDAGVIKNNHLWSDLTETERPGSNNRGSVAQGSKQRGQAIRPSHRNSPLSRASRSMPSREERGKTKTVSGKRKKSLGSPRFFGSPGSRYRSSSRRSFGRNQNGQTIKKKKLPNKAQQARRSLKLPPDLLKRNFNRKYRRRTADNSEINGPETSLFQKVCEHYDHFTRTHGILDYQRRCQK